MEVSVIKTLIVIGIATAIVLMFKWDDPNG